MAFIDMGDQFIALSEGRPQPPDHARHFGLVVDAESAFDEESLWPVHPLDDEVTSIEALAIYIGASGVIWALDELERRGAVELRRNWAPTAVALHGRYVGGSLGAPTPSLFGGESGILLVAHRLAPAPWQEERLLACIRANVANPFWELMWGSPGTLVAAQVMHERTSAERWAEAWRESADRLWEEWRDELWVQNLYGKFVQVLGPAHGFVGNVYALARGQLLDEDRRAGRERRALASVGRRAPRADGVPPQAPPPPPRTPGQFPTPRCD